MKNDNIRKFLILIMLIAITSMFACRAATDVYEVSTQAADSISALILPDEKPVLKKKILVTPVINRAGISDSLAEEMRQECVSYLSKNKYLDVITLKKWNENEPEFVQKQYGAVINPAYAKKAGEMGMNIVAACVIHPVEITQKRTGIWPFRKDSRIALLSISINAVDTVNGTLVVYKDESKNINLGRINKDDDAKFVPDYNMLKDEMSSLIKELCSTLTERLEKVRWQSKVTIEGDSIIINAGKDIGINDNTVFELYKKGEPLESFSGKEYFVFGKKIGESRVKSVSADRAVLAVNASGDYRDTVFVRVKRDD